MDWTLWILLSAVFLALYDLAKKASVRENAVLPVLVGSTICGSAAFALGLFLSGRLGAALAGIGPLQLLLGFTKAVIVATSWIFTFTALRTLPITIATPIRAMAPLLVFVLALGLYGEMPGVVQALGMALVFGGYFLFSWAGRCEGIDFRRNRAVWCAFAGAFFSAMSALYDKFVFQVLAAPVEGVQLVFQVSLVVVYALCLGVTMLWRGCRHLAGEPFEWRWSIPLVGVLLALADWLYFTGLALPEVPISVASLLRRFSVVITFLLGAKMFRERNLWRKGVALTAILTGVALICWPA